MRMLNTRISCRIWKIHTTNDPTFIDSVEEKIYMKPCTMQSWGFPVFLWTQWLKTPLMMVHPHFLVCWIPIRVQFLFGKWPCLLMNSSFVGCIPSSACQRDQKRMEQTLENDPLWQNTMEYAQFFPIVGSQLFLVPSSLHVPLRTSTSDWSLSVDLRVCSWGDWSVESSAADAAFNARHEKCFPYIPLFNPFQSYLKSFRCVFSVSIRWPNFVCYFGCLKDGQPGL